MSTDDTEVPLVGGWATEGVVRVGETVRRPAGPQSPFVAELLLFLEQARFERAPRFLGYDEQGRETLTFIEGEVPSDCRSAIWTDDRAAQARMLRLIEVAPPGAGREDALAQILREQQWLREHGSLIVS